MPKVLRRRGSQVRELDLHGYPSEKEFQQLLTEHPSLIPGCSHAAVAREFQLPGMGYVDLLLLDGDGEITLVECKLAANAEIKRKVVGQLLAYAAGLWQMTVDDFGQLWRQRTGMTPVESVGAKEGEVHEAKFRTALADNLEAAQFRLVFAVDEITAELRRTVEFLNLTSVDRLAVMALEVGRFVEGEVELIVPSTYGAELAAASSPAETRESNRWSLQQVEDQLAQDSQFSFALGQLLAQATNASAEFKGGTAKDAPSGGMYFQTPEGPRSLWSIYTTQGNERVILNLGSVWGTAPERAELAGQLLVDASLVTSSSSGSAIASKYTAIRLDQLNTAEAIGAVLKAVDALRAAEESVTRSG